MCERRAKTANSPSGQIERKGAALVWPPETLAAERKEDDENQSDARVSPEGHLPSGHAVQHKLTWFAAD